jgi:hypothetical protein
MEMLKPNFSSHIHSAGYDPETQTMTVKFHKGGVYHYHGVPESVHTKLLNAESAGNFMHNNVKGKFQMSRPRG